MDAGEDGRFPGRAEAGVDRAEEALRQQAVARHRQKHARLAEHQHQHDGGDAGHRAQRDDELRPAQSDPLERHGDGGVHVDLVVGDHAGEHEGHGDVQDRADEQRGDDAEGDVPLRIAGLLGVGRDRVEPDVGEEDHRGPGQHAHGRAVGAGLSPERLAEEAQTRPAEGGERLPVGGLDVERPDADDQQHDGHLDRHHRVVEAGTLPDADHQHDRQDRDDDQRRQVEPAAGGREVPRGRIEVEGGVGQDVRHLRG